MLLFHNYIKNQSNKHIFCSILHMKLIIIIPVGIWVKRVYLYNTVNDVSRWGSYIVLHTRRDTLKLAVSLYTHYTSINNARNPPNRLNRENSIYLFPLHPLWNPFKMPRVRYSHCKYTPTVRRALESNGYIRAKQKTDENDDENKTHDKTKTKTTNRQYNALHVITITQVCNTLWFILLWCDVWW